MNRAKLRSQLKDYQGAIADYSEAIKINRYDASAHSERGKIRELLGDEVGAAKDLEAAETAARLSAVKSKTYWGLGRTGNIKIVFLSEEAQNTLD